MRKIVFDMNDNAEGIIENDLMKMSVKIPVKTHVEAVELIKEIEQLIINKLIK